MSFKKEIINLANNLAPNKKYEEENEDTIEKKMIIIPIVILFGIFISLIYPMNVNMSVTLLIGFLVAGFAGTGLLMPYALRYFSIGLVTPISHSSSRRLGPLKRVKVIDPEGNQIDYAIFDLGGISVNVFAEDGGGRNGYIVVPEGGYIIRGGSITILNDMVRYEHNALIEPIRIALSEHKKYKIGSPVYMAIIPPVLDVELIKNAFSMQGTQNFINDINTMMKLSTEHATVSDALRRSESMMHADSIRKSVSRFPKRRQFTPVNREEAEKEDEENE